MWLSLVFVKKQIILATYRQILPRLWGFCTNWKRNTTSSTNPSAQTYRQTIDCVSLGCWKSRYRLGTLLIKAIANGICELNWANRRRHQLMFMIEHFRRRMVSALSPSEKYYYVENMPLEIWKFGRDKLTRICQETNLITGTARYTMRTISAIRFKPYVYNGTINTFDISSAPAYEINYLNYLKIELHHWVLVVDKGSCKFGFVKFCSLTGKNISTLECGLFMSRIIITQII